MESDNKLERKIKRIDGVVRSFEHAGIFGLVLLVSMLFMLLSIYRGAGIFALLLFFPLFLIVPAIALIVLRNQQPVKPIFAVTLLPALCYLVISANQIIAPWIFFGSLESAFSEFRFNIFTEYPFLGIHAAIFWLGYMLKFIKRKHVAQPEQDAAATSK
ncbi:hypothetical protein [Mobiluncus mulieris]|uniref:Uncharacterized protein n=1 Tax=Mobiluncus mulieris TaxID=2052 RepID=A0ABD4TTL4_9ACTO|nr:hypothetical protein [Mobiluncus mulieris]EFN93334.1 hypothetical protein HMPREF9278_1656 [Mobiluncus mulieris FB024-16]MCU9968255.1 hypothetical protein [Mobiluncus mulieris]MCU9972434.1 hypothetical protein [Mobiluncus mulieris]MCV0008524.1 hypothetical protein [Mobiluncus mulieris]MCV0010621.1 hypothetical protein [Mobiluncus mulieris]